MDSEKVKAAEVPSKTAVDAVAKDNSASNEQPSSSDQHPSEAGSDSSSNHGATPFEPASMDEVDAWDGIEGQIALDSFLTGESERPLMELFARAEGIDVKNLNQYRLRSSKWEAPMEEDGRRLSFLGAVDQLVDLQDRYDFSHKARDLELGDKKDNVQGKENSGGPRELAPDGSQTFAIRDDHRMDVHDVEAYVEPGEAFEYDSLPLGSRRFRLLAPAPPDEQGHISSLNLKTFDLDNAPLFYALSYVWNSPEKTVPMTCNGKKLMITNSLGLALGKSVPWSRGVYLWADGICINQDNIAERNHQVTLMSGIYSRASKVLAHLGYSTPSKSDSGDWSAVSLMTLLNRIWINEPDHSMKPESEWTKILATNHDNATMWAALVTFWMNPWFTRCWIAQEAILTDTVGLFFGKATCSLNAVTTFWDLTQRRDLPKIMKYSPLADIYAACRNISMVGSFKKLREWHYKPSVTGETQESVRHSGDGLDSRGHTEIQNWAISNASLLNLLAMSRSNGATDERDKVYALLALAKDETAKTVTPDYSANNTTAKVYTDVAEKYIRRGLGTELLQYAGVDNLTAGLPSWVPDWSHQSRSTFRAMQFSCSGKSQAQITSGPDQGKLYIRGAIIDSLEYLGFPCRFYSLDSSQDRLYRSGHSDDLPPVETDMHMRQVVYATAKMLFQNFCTSDRYPEGWATALGRTLTADCTRSGERSDPVFMESFAAFKEFNDQSLEMSVQSAPVEPGSEKDKLLDQAWRYESAVQEVQKGRRICVTKGGYMGVTTHDAEKGDLLVIFQGFTMPFVLRRKDDDFLIVGDCYIHGIMDGELICTLEDKFELGESQTEVDRQGDRFYIQLPTDRFTTFQDFTII